MSGPGQSSRSGIQVTQHRTSSTDTYLAEILGLIGMNVSEREGWGSQTARLYALDIAMVVVNRNVNVIAEVGRQTLFGRLQEARTLVVSGRDDELGFVQGALESHLALTREGRERHVWLTVIDAMIPNPYRAALITTRDALSLGATATFSDFAGLARDRLVARLDEGKLMTQPAPALYLIA